MVCVLCVYEMCSTIIMNLHTRQSSRHWRNIVPRMATPTPVRPIYHRSLKPLRAGGLNSNILLAALGTIFAIDVAKVFWKKHMLTIENNKNQKEVEVPPTNSEVVRVTIELNSELEILEPPMIHRYHLMNKKQSHMLESLSDDETEFPPYIAKVDIFHDDVNLDSMSSIDEEA
jgi:hypothetical protein